MTVARKISYGLLAGFVIALLGGLASLHALEGLTRTDRQLQETHASLGHIARVFELLVDEQTGLRGYALTGQQKFLEPYLRARTELPEAMATLRDTAARSPSQLAQIDQLGRVAEERRAYAETLITVRREQGLDAAAALVATGRGNEMMTRARRIVSELEDEQQRRLTSAARADRAAARVAFRLDLMATATMLLLVLAASALLRRAVTIPAAEMRDVVERVADGDLTVELPARAADEFGRIARSFNRMVQQRRSAEEALRRANALLDGLFRASPLAIVAVDPSGKVDVWNPAAEHTFGWTTSEALGRPLQVIPEAELPGFEQLRARVLEERAVFPRFEQQRKRKDGTLFDARMAVAPRTHGGEPAGMMAIIEDVTERKRVAEALRLSESKLRELIDQAPDGIFIADLEGRYTEVNPAACRMLGYTRDELVGKTIVELLPPEDVPRLAESRGRLLSPGQSEVAEWSLARKDGTFVPVEVSAKILADGRWQAFVRDITDRKRAEQALRSSEESLSRAQRIAHLGSWDRDLRTEAVTRSAEVYAIYGVPQTEELAHPNALVRFLHPEDRERVMEGVDRAARLGTPFNLEHRLVRPSGEERTVRLAGECIREDGVPVRMIGTLLDITDLKRAEREREETLGWLRQVLEASPVGLLLIRGARGDRVEANRRAEEMLGRSVETVEEYVGKILTPDGQVVAREDLPSTRALRGERVTWAEYGMRNAKGRVIPVVGTAAPVLDPSGRIQGAVVVYQDITPVKDLERLRAEWNSVVAHDLRQPLNVIGLSTQVLLAKASTKELRAPLDRIADAARRLERMIQDLFDLSRLDARQLELSRELVDVLALAQAGVDRASIAAPDRQFCLSASGVVPNVDADPDRLAQVMDNLLSNAVKYGTPSAPVLVEVRGEHDRVSVAVTNEGAGIAKEELPRLFQRFHRTDEARRSGVRGIGLGLYITRELVEAHGGEMTAESTPGATTTFRFTIPVARSPARA